MFKCNILGFDFGTDDLNIISTSFGFCLALYHMISNYQHWVKESLYLQQLLINVESDYNSVDIDSYMMALLVRSPVIQKNDLVIAAKYWTSCPSVIKLE